MRAISPLALRWSAGMGALGAVLGVLALLGGALLEPVHPVTDALSVAVAVFVRSLLALVTLAITLLLAYLAGWRIELAPAPVALSPAPVTAAPAPENATNAPDTTDGGATGHATTSTRMQAALAGAIILFCYWFFTTLYIVLFGSSIGGIGAQNGGSPLSFTISHVLLGAVYIGLGAGFASLGSRAAAARRLMRALTQLASAPPAPATTSAASTPPSAPSDASADEGERAQP